MTFRPMPLLTGFSLVSLVILILLGHWQYNRYTEKINAPPMSERAAERVRLEINIQQANPGNAQQVYGFADSEPIWRRYLPGTVASTGEPVLVMVEATGGPNPVPAAIAAFPASIVFEGALLDKRSNGNAFSARDRPTEDLWYRLDPEKLAQTLGLKRTPRVAEPTVITVRNSVRLDQTRQTLNPYGFEEPVDPLPPERHFGYALTWWGMALALIAVYVAFHRSAGRLKF
ncbi:MAG: SURF1 family cytochrome oxidase biogenesis protein [Pseudomonadota bacterium]